MAIRAQVCEYADLWHPAPGSERVGYNGERRMSQTTVLAALAVTLLLSPVIVALLRVDWTPGRFKVVYHLGPVVDVKTRMASGWLTLEDGQMKFRGERELSVSLGGLRSVELFRHHGLGRMIRITHQDGPINLTVVRFCIAGRLATADFFKTGKLMKQLASEIPTAENEPTM